MQGEDNDTHPLTPTLLTREAFGRRVYNLMLKKGWRQSELARRADIQRSSISAYIRGQAFPTDINLDRIAKALGVEKTDLLPNQAIQAMQDSHSSFEIRVHETDKSKAWIKVNQLVNASTAAKVFQLLNDDVASSDAV